jgi:group II intron reverse transcriptase/maturase
VNIGDPWPDLTEAEHRVLVMQTKLHQWAKADPSRRFDDLGNLVYDPAFLVVAWARVRGNKGARTAGVDGVKPRSIVFGAAVLLDQLRDDLKAGRFVPQRVREKTIPKASGKIRSLGIPTTTDRVVQASLKLVLEPIFEADFKPCSYGFRPRRRVQDAIAEIHYLASPNRNYGWVFEGDIKACFDEIDHTALMGRVRDRIGDRRILGWVKAFLRAGILTEEGLSRETITGTPQGGILSPLLANIALSVLDEYFTHKWDALGPAWTRAKHRRAGDRVMKLVRYADDCVTRMQRRERCRRSNFQMQCCAKDGGRSSGVALQGEAPNHRKLRRLRAGVVSVAEKAGREPVRCEPRRRAKANHLMTGRKRSGDIKSGVESLPRDESGGNLPTAQAVSGLKMARARFRLWHGTCEPASRYRPVVDVTFGHLAGESENSKWQNPRGAE